MADETERSRLPTKPARWKRPWVYAALVGLLILATSPWWALNAFWATFVALHPYRVTISNHAAEDVVSGQFEAYGRGHSIGRIESGKSRTLLIWAPWSHDINRAVLIFASGRMLQAQDQPYAPYFYQHYVWEVDEAGTTLKDGSPISERLDVTGRLSGD